MLSHASWYAARLRAMSVPEIGYRFQQMWERARLRLTCPDPNQIVGNQRALPIFPGLAEAAVELARYPDLLQGWCDLARGLANGAHDGLGQSWPLTKQSDKWHLDPISGRLWPRDAFCFDIDFRRQQDLGDAKYVWELNRLQRLQPVAALGAVTNNDEVCEICLAELESWIDANPPFFGLNWSSGIELALRIMSIVVVTTLVNSNRFSDELRAKVVRTLAYHGIWLERFPSRFSSANNHLIAEAAGLFILGALLPDLPRAAEWLSTSRRILEREALLQILPDGVGAEQSLTYSAFTLEWLLVCSLLAKRLGAPFPNRVLDRLHAGATFLKALVDTAGNSPKIGDDDEGSVLFFTSGGEAYVRAIIGYSASALDQPNLAAGAPMQFGNVLFAHAAVRQHSEPGFQLFPTGGYSVARLGAGDDEVLLVVDHGALGYLSLAAHGHADALSIWLHLSGRPVLVDAGTFGYKNAGPWRRYFKGTPAHNTLAVGGESSSTFADSFIWSQKASARPVLCRLQPEITIEGEHDGFHRRFGAIHRRRVSVCSRQISVCDSLIGAGRQLPVEINWLFHPDLRAQIDGDVCVVTTEEDAPLLKVRGVGPLKPRLYHGHEHPVRGWYSRRFGQKEPAYQCSFQGLLADTEPFTCKFDIVGFGKRPDHRE